MAHQDQAFQNEFPALAAGLETQFSVLREIGRGGMGVVYLARDDRLDRLVAIKVLPAASAQHADARERFIREARTAARLAHPNVVPVHRADEVEGVAFFVMSYVEGQSLAEYVRDRGTLPPADAIPILRDVAYALAYAHARGVIHRDIKPENILIERSSRRTLVTDFGIAQQTTMPQDVGRLTADGHILGTVHFMSPEQVEGRPLDGRSDLYALGVVGYFALSGRLPFEGLAAPAVFVAHATRPAPPLRSVAPGVSPEVAAVIDRCLAKTPDERFATGEALAEALQFALTATTGSSRAAGHVALPPGVPERLAEEQAAAVWQRAAQLQADAIRRRDLHEQAMQRLQGTDMPADLTEGYRIGDVAAAAEEAGISRQYVAMALAELPRGGAALERGLVAGFDKRRARLYLGSDTQTLAVTVQVPATPARTLRALGAVLQQSPFMLQLRETVGSHPLDGGVIVFDLPGTGVVPSPNGTGVTLNPSWMRLQHTLKVRQLQVTLRATPGDPSRTDVTMTCDIRPGVGYNIRTSKWLSGVVGGSVGVLTGGVLAKGAAVAASAAVLGPAAASAVLVGAAGLALYRMAYPGVVNKARGELEAALRAVVAAVQSEDVFGSIPDRRMVPQPVADNNADALIVSI